ncbi:hypothetical protein AAD018_010020 [Aestuariibius insulae]|uniref:hypothetical protein n=1 Tax=Aestuariibius insulae TaxID=2058287 RepID=UPI00345EE3F8
MRLFGQRAEAERRAALLAAGDLTLGQTILEIEPGKGALTEALLRLVADDGELIVQQPTPLDAFFGQKARRRMERASNARYSHTTWEALDAADGSVERVVWVQGPHELWFEPGSGISLGQPATVFAEIARVLASSGKFLVVDNLAPPRVSDAQAGNLHRSDPRTIAALAQMAGLGLLRKEIEWVKSPSDPLDVPTYSRATRGAPRQWMQVWRKG